MQFVHTNLFLNFAPFSSGKRQTVLWPVRVYRVLYPEPRRTRLNLFERAILGLIRAKRWQVTELQTLTGLHPDLIKLIIANCISRNWLEHSGEKLTHEGAKTLDDEEVDNQDLKAGYLFQDAITGHFWPRMSTTLNEVEPINPHAKQLKFSLSRKEGSSITPYLLEPVQSDLPSLTPEQLNRAYREYRRDVNAYKQLEGSYGSNDLTLPGVQQLDDSPEQAYMLLDITADHYGEQLFMVKDPFEIREHAWWLTEGLNDLLARDKQFCKRLGGLVGRADMAEQTAAEWIKSLQNETELELLTSYPWLEKQASISRYFARLIEKEKSVQQGNQSPANLEAALSECQMLLEVVMQWLIKTYPIAKNAVPHQERHSFKLNREILKGLGIPAATDSVIATLAGQRLSQVARAAQSPKASLKALLFAAALGVFEHTGHPLLHLSAEQLALEELLKLANLRNQTSHAQSEFNAAQLQQVTADLVLGYINYCKKFTEQFKDWF
ncbi:hypothetical protein [Salinibius halmophilus]|uniref:hypothetical protein n=1 Tax=Salinibius halmophilus TaxID=1853216 RepID=UPI000E66ACBC|nr:hypothetical protein [Salinibius halmophilus]